MVITSRSVDVISDFSGHNQKSDNAAKTSDKKKTDHKMLQRCPRIKLEIK